MGIKDHFWCQFNNRFINSRYCVEKGVNKQSNPTIINKIELRASPSKDVEAKPYNPLSNKISILDQVFFDSRIFFAIYGTASGLQSVNNRVVWSNYFGKLYLGSIRGISMVGNLISFSIGPQ